VAVTLDSYLPFDSGAGATVLESQWRDMAKHFIGSASGVIRGFANAFQTIGDSSGMQVKVNTGECFMRGHFGASSSQKTLPIASNSSGNPRIDIVVLRVHFGNNNIVLDVVTGTPAASPSPPSVTQNTTMWETLLAQVAVANGAATITSGNVTDRRVYTSGVAKFTKTNATSVPASTYTSIPFNTIEIPTGDVTLGSTSTIVTVERAGIWNLAANVGFEPSSSGGRRIIIADASDNSYARSDTPTMGASEQTYLSASTTERLSAGATVKIRAWQNGAVPINTVAGWVTLVLTWVGP
jgi:hypothetical protein